MVSNISHDEEGSVMQNYRNEEIESAEGNERENETQDLLVRPFRIDELGRYRERLVQKIQLLFGNKSSNLRI